MSKRIYFRQIEVGPMANFAYLIGDRQAGECAVVDPAWEVERLVEEAERDDMRITKALVTHFHPDHLGGDLMGHHVPGAAELVERVPAKVHMHKSELPFVARLTGLSASDIVPTEAGDEIRIGDLTVKVLHTPGHSPGSQCFLVRGALVAGDTLFVGSCGRVDLPGSSAEDMYRSLTQTLAALPNETVLYPGHNYGPQPASTVGDEKRTNPTMRFRSLKDFLAAMSPLAF